MQSAQDVAAIRLDNALLLFDEFVRATVKHADAATLRGLERRFAERLQIQPSYWSQIKGRSRQIGERLARQFEQCCHKPVGWMDQRHGTPSATGTAPSPGTVDDANDPALPRDDDERFIVGLVLTYYRRHPQRARTRLLDLLGEVLVPPPPAAPNTVAASGRGVSGSVAGHPGSSPLAAGGPAASPPAAVDDQQVWAQVRSGVAPLSPKRGGKR